MKNIREGYKMTELGEIPEEWEVKELNDITSVITKGTTPTTYGYDFEDEGINFIKIESINDVKGTLLEETFSKISEECHKKLSRSILEEDDILFAIAGATIGKCAITTKECLPANTNQALAIIRLNQNIDSKFIFHQLRGPLIQNKIENLKTNTAQPNLNLKQIGEFTILLPTLKEQQKLSLILNCVDEQIENTDNLIEKTKELKKGLMHKLLTKGIGHSRFRDTEIGKIPEEWEVKTMEDVIVSTQLGTNTLGKENVSNGIPMLKMGNLTIGGFNFNTVEYIENEELEINKDFILNRGDFLFNTRNTLELVGKSGTWNNQLPVAIFNSNIMRIKYKPNVDSFYMSYYFENSGGWKLLKAIATGTTSVAAIYIKDLLKVKVKLPNIGEQKQIASILSSIGEQINQYEFKKEKLQELKKGLMQKLLTGKVRVKV